MKHHGFQYNFSPKELMYFLFKKKICPACGGGLKREKGFETVKGRDLNSKVDPFFIPQADIKHYTYSFVCQQCGSRFTLQELTK